VLSGSVTINCTLCFSGMFPVEFPCLCMEICNEEDYSKVNI
jgi:hypothetical protein